MKKDDVRDSILSAQNAQGEDQAVDVGAIHDLIDRMKNESNGFQFIRNWVYILTRAIGKK